MSECVPRSMREVVARILADLRADQPRNLYDAATKLRDLLAALRGSIQEVLAETGAESPDYTAALSEASVRVEAVDAVVKALAGLDKAQEAATAAVEQAFKKFYAPRVEQRVWRKLTPATV